MNEKLYWVAAVRVDRVMKLIYQFGEPRIEEFFHYFGTKIPSSLWIEFFNKNVNIEIENKLKEPVALLELSF